MPTTIRRKYGGKYRGEADRIPEPEQSLWRRFKEYIPDDTINIYFDVGLGKGKKTNENVEENIRKNWYLLTQKRADVILVNKESVLIIELKGQAQSSALGTLLMYKKLYLEDPVLGKNVEVALVTDVLDDDTKGMCEDMGINYIIV